MVIHTKILLVIQPIIHCAHIVTSMWQRALITFSLGIVQVVDTHPHG